MRSIKVKLERSGVTLDGEVLGCAGEKGAVQLLIDVSSIAQEGDIILKVLHNETEVHIPVQTDIFPFYRWTDVRAYYNAIISRGGMID